MRFMSLNKLRRRFHDLYLLLAPIVDQAIISVTNFVATILLVSVTDLPVFGELSYLIVISFMGQNLIASMIIWPMNILAVQHKQEFESFLFATLVLMLLFATAAALLFFAGSLLTHSANTFETLMFCIAFISMCVQDCGRRQLYLRLFRWLTMAVTVARYAIPVVFLFAISRSGSRLTPTEYWQLIAGSSLLAILIQFFFCRPAGTSADMVGRTAREYIAHGSWLLGQNAIQLLSDNALLLISGWLLPMAEIGIWRSLQTVAGFLNPLLISLENIIPARAQKRYQEDGKKAGNIWLRNAFLISGIPIFLAALTIAVFARQITTILFPSIPLGWEWIAQCYCAIIFLQMLKSFAVLHARLYGRGDAILASSMATFVLSLMLAYPLPKFFGIQGSVYGIVGLQLFGVASAILFQWLRRETVPMHQNEQLL